MKSEKTADTTRKYYILGFKIFADFGLTIAVPVVVLSRIGKYLDKTHPLGNWPWYTIIGFVIAAIITAYMIRQKAKSYAKEYQSIEDKTKN